ncbi:hypothetical protein AAEU29_12610 [Pseudoalteromonas sp. SSM20]|uniref:hypothetical protein n=1 Tax=Pseudoalteromonas sp. SSM20 TaxID=3139394 RepID=UPI003BA970FE
MNKNEIERKIFKYLNSTFSKYGFLKDLNSLALIRRFDEVLQVVSCNSVKGCVSNPDGWQVYIYLDIWIPEFSKPDSFKNAKSAIEIAPISEEVRAGVLGASLPILDLKPECGFQIPSDFKTAFEKLVDEKILLWLSVFSTKETVVKYKKPDAYNDGVVANIIDASNFLNQFQQTNVKYLEEYTIINVIDEQFVEKDITPILAAKLMEMQFKLVKNIKYDGLYRIDLGDGWVAAVMFGPANEITLGIECMVYCRGFSQENWEEYRFNQWGIDQAFKNLLISDNLCQLPHTTLANHISDNVFPEVIGTLNQMLNKSYLRQYIESNYRYGADDFTQDELLERLEALPVPRIIQL